MAAQTLTNVTRNYDDAAMSGLLNGETTNINNSNLIINSDSRWGQQACVMGSLNISTSLGGTITLDGRDVWWVPFDASSGLVPSLGTAGVNDCTGSIAGTGEFLGVFPTTMLAPLTAGAAMPTSGFIKLRKKTISFVDNEVITFASGATVTINSATGGQRGWIHVVGVELGTVSVPRLGKFTSIGDYFELGVTNGLDDQTFQFPIADTCPCFQMETAVGSGVYEWWTNSGSRWGTATQFVPTDERGKFFGINKTTGVITIAQRATNACGYKPISGLRVRIPNIIVSCSSAANWNLNLIHVTLASRYDFTTTAAGEVDIQHLCGSWTISTTAAYSVSIKNSSLLNVQLVNLALPAVLDNIGFGMDTNIEAYHLSCVSLFSGVTLSNIYSRKYASVVSGGSSISMSDSIDINITNVVVGTFGAAATTERGVSTARSMIFTRCSNISIENSASIGATLSFVTSSVISLLNYKYAERINGETSGVVPIYAIEVSASCSNVYMEEFSFLYPSIANLHPYYGVITCSSSSNIDIRNCGSIASKIDGGSANRMAVFLSASVCVNVAIRRCYLENLRTNLFIIPNTTQNVIIENVWGDATDLAAISCLAVTPKGCKWTPYPAGQSAVYGRHCEDSFGGDTNGKIYFAANEALPSTIDQISITAGTPKFTSGGAIQMPTIGDQVEWTMPYFAIGHTGFGGLPNMYMAGTLMGAMNFDYQIDTGLGFSAWKNLMACRYRSSGGTAGTSTVTYTAIVGGREPQIGDYVGTYLGTHFATGTTISNIVGTTITFSSPILVTISPSLAMFFWKDIQDEPAINPLTGVKLKIRATTIATNTTSNVYYVAIPTTTTLLDQQIQYPFPVVLNEAKVVGIEAGSRIRIYNTTTLTEIANELVIGTEWSLLYGEGSSFTDGDIIEVRISKTGYLPSSFITLATATGWAGLVTQEIDAVYTLNAIDGSTVTELTGDFPNIQIDSADADGETTVQRIYAWFSYVQTTEQGIRDFFEAMLAEDEVNYRIKATVANLKLDNTITTPLMIIGGRMYRDDGQTVIAATSNSIQLDPDKAYAIDVSGGGAPTVSEISSAVWSEIVPNSFVEGSAGYKLGSFSVAVSGSAPVSVVATGFVLTTGLETGTYLNTTLFNNSYHQIDDVGNSIDCYYIFNIGENSMPISVSLNVNLRSAYASLSVYAWSFLSSEWVEIGVIDGRNGTGFSDVSINVLSSLVGSGANDGEVRIRLAGSGTDPVLRIDYLTLGYSVIALTAQQIADGVWNSLVAGHITADSMGVLLKNIEEEVLKRLKKTDFIALK